ncbi:two-component regulator propeller domain-containing protein [Bacteroidota bacterium]
MNKYRMIHITILLFMIFFMHHYNSYSKEDIEWVTYKSNKLHVLFDDGNYIWAGGDKYVSKINKSTGVKIIYHESNSGLPPNDVKCIAEDSQGDKWIGTISGLAKFDGTNWSIFDDLNSGLPHEEIRCLVIDKNDVKWIGTKLGVARYDDSSWTVYNESNSDLPYNSIVSIAIDLNDNIWIGTFNHGVAKFDGITWTVYNESNSDFPGNPGGQNVIYSIYVDSNSGDIWFGTSNEGVVKFDGSDWTAYNTSNSELPEGVVQCITMDKNGAKWIGTSRGGIAKFEGSTWTVYNESNSGLPDNWVTSIIIDSDEIIWIGTWLGGLARYDGSLWTVYTASNSGLLDDWITSVSIDNLGIKWVGTKQGGLTKFDGTNWTIYNESNSGLPSNTVNCISIDNNDTKWIGTPAGITKFDGSNWTVSNEFNSGLPDNQINCITIDKNDVKWIGTYYNGIAKYDGINWELFDTLSSDLPDNNINCITIDKNDVKWIGTHNGGLAKYDGTTWTVFNISNSNIPDNLVRCIAIDSNNNKWVGTNSGVAQFDGQNWMIYNTMNSSLPNDMIYSIAVDENNVKWIGSSVNTIGTIQDLSKFDGINWTHYNYYNSGLPNDIVTSITFDDRGDKWLGTKGGGLAYYSEKIFTENFIGEYCAGQEFEINFTVKEQFNNGNLFTAQLSDFRGVFENKFEPVIIGSLNGRNSGSISVKLPKDFYLDGSNYRIRVSGSDPYARGVDNGRNLTIHSSPQPKISGSFQVFPGSLEKYECTGGKIIWRIEKGIIEDSTSLYINVRWNEPGQGKIILIEESSYSCVDSVIQDIIISSPDFEIQGKNAVCDGDIEIYYTERIPDSEILWTVESNGTIIGENTEDSVLVSWESSGDSRVIVQQTINGFPNEKFYNITINERPLKPTIELAGEKLISNSTNGNQWFHNDTLIPGAINQIYTPIIKTGYYQVQVTNESGCTSELSGKYYYDKNPTVSFRIGNGSIFRAKPGEEIQVPIYLISDDDLTSYGVEAIEARFSYNYTLLKPLNTNENRIDNGERIINLYLPIVKDQDLLTTLNLKAMLGNSLGTDLILDSIEVSGGTVNITGNEFAGHFELEGVCMEGGFPRLISNRGKAQLILLSPNPANESCELEYELIEEGSTKIYICNTYGEVIKTILNGEITMPGKNKLSIKTNDLSTGMYFVILETPTIRKAVKMEVVK